MRSEARPQEALADQQMERALDLVAFDADDTLWHNERSYRDGRERFSRLLRAAGVELDEASLEERINQTELANLEYFGYGVSSFALSLIETAVDLTGGAIRSAALLEIVALAKEMLTERVELFPHAREIVAFLAPSYPLMLITKGDLLHQTSKLDRSGLREHFRFVEVVSHKTLSVYAEIIARHGVPPGRFLMIGNSLRSDVLPVIELGGWAVHVPAALSWSHEHVDVAEEMKRRYFEIAALDQLPAVIESLAESGPPCQSSDDH
jgi:putative hydrolase of the HAD superfamily